MPEFKNSQIQTQAQSQVQVQSLSPQQVLEAKLLELSTIEIEDRVRAELDDNPALEEGFEDTVHENDEPDYGDETLETNPHDDFLSEDDEPDLDDLKEVEDIKLEDLDMNNAIEGVSIDDPVRMYLREIGRIPLVKFNNYEGLELGDFGKVYETEESGKPILVSNHRSFTQYNLERSNMNWYDTVNETLRLNASLTASTSIIKLTNEIYQQAISLEQ